MKNLGWMFCLLVVMTTIAPVGAEERLDDSVRTILDNGEPLKTAVDRGFAVRDGRIQVVMLSSGGSTSALEDWLWSHGARFVLAVRGRVQAFVPPELLLELDRHPDVVSVECPAYAELPEPAPPAAARKQTALAVTSEGVAKLNVEPWNAEGFTGVGIRVGIIDVQYGGWEDLLGVELPPAGQTIYRAFGGSSVTADEVHGTACAEIVHDIAPDAVLYLAHIRSLTDFIAALDWLALQGVDVVTMSLGWTGSAPGDGTGEMAEEISAFVNATDAVFFTSAGNERRSHWQGQTIDADSDDWVDFEPGADLNELGSTVGADERVSVTIVWDDWSSPATDYSLHLYKLGGAEPEEVAVSDRPQTGQWGQKPFEQVSYTAPDGGRFGVRINRAGVVGNNDMELFSPDSDIGIRVAEGSLTIPSDGEDVIAVAAISYNPSYGVRSFSSAGPTNGPGGSFTGGEIKPDLASFDGVSTVSYGPQQFYGTSAAAPHAAGAAAVVRNAEPGYDREQTQAFLEARAVDQGTAGKDNDYGWGRTFLGQSPGSDCAFSIDPTSASVSAARGGGIIRVTTNDGCPWNTSSRVEWITVAPPSGVGGRSVGFTVQANTGPERVGELVVADLVFVVTQAGGECSFVLSPTSQGFTHDGGDGLFTVQTEAGCSWSATTVENWITLTAGSGSGPGTVLFSAEVNQGVDQRTGSIAVGDESFSVIQDGAPVELTTMVAGIAETEGAAQTRWKSDLAILNPGTTPVQVDLQYRHSQGMAQSSLSLGGGEIVEFVNVAAGTFGVPDSSGAVEVVSDQPVIVTARIYNDAPDGTFGQFISGVTEDLGLSAGGGAALTQLSGNGDFRTNIGFVDLGGAGATARVRLFDGAGMKVGSELDELVPAGGWTQINRVFRSASSGDCTGCYALIDIIGDGGPIWAYASVVDNDSGDPTTIPMELVEEAKITADERYLVAGIAEVEGANQTKWKSNLALLNLSGQGVTADLTYRHSGGSEVSSVTMADSELREFVNIAADLFGVPGSAGAVDIDTDGMLVVTARTYNASPSGTFGQFLPGLGSSAALTPGYDGYLSQLKSTDDFRTNIGFSNYGETECVVRTYLHDETGEQTGMFFATVPAGGWTQVNRVFVASGAGPCSIGFAVVEVLTPGCEVWSYASVVDNGTGDPTTVPVVIE